MRKAYIFLSLLMAVMILAVPVIAGSRSYVQDLSDEWIEYAEDEGYEVFYTDIDMIDDENSISYYLDLEPGYYYFVAEGGEDTEDIDMYVYDSDGYELASDTMADNYPICEIELRYPDEIEIEIVAYSFYGREYEDYFCFVAAAEYDEDYGREESYLSDDLEEILDYWEDWVDDSGYELVYSDTGYLSRENSEFYTIDLTRGMYHVYAESLNEEDDIDLYVWDEYGEEIQSDTLADNYPICSFNLRSAETVEIEVAPYTYVRGNSTEYAIVVAVEGGGGMANQPMDDRPGRDEAPTDRSDHEYVNGVLDDYMDMVIDEGLEMIYDEVELLDEYGKTVQITLGRGDYVIYAEGGLRINDLDMSVYNEDGYVLAEDTLTDNYPICEFTIYESTSVEIEVYPYDMDAGWDEGYYVLVVTRE